MEARVSVTQLIAPYYSLSQKRAAGEQLTEEEMDEFRSLVPVAIAYEELMRQIKKHRENKENKEKE